MSDRTKLDIKKVAVPGHSVEKRESKEKVMGNVHDVPSYRRLKAGRQRGAKRSASDGDAKSTVSKLGANKPMEFHVKTFEGRILYIGEAVDRMDRRRKVIVDKVRNLLTLMRDADVEGTEKMKTALLKYEEVSREDRSNAESAARLERVWRKPSRKPSTTLWELIDDTYDIVYYCDGDDQTLLAQIAELTERVCELRKRCSDEVAQ